MNVLEVQEREKLLWVRGFLKKGFLVDVLAGREDVNYWRREEKSIQVGYISQEFLDCK